MDSYVPPPQHSSLVRRTQYTKEGKKRPYFWLAVAVSLLPSTTADGMAGEGSSEIRAQKVKSCVAELSCDDTSRIDIGKKGLVWSGDPPAHVNQIASQRCRCSSVPTRTKTTLRSGRLNNGSGRISYKVAITLTSAKTTRAWIRFSTTRASTGATYRGNVGVRLMGKDQTAYRFRHHFSGYRLAPSLSRNRR